MEIEETRRRALTGSSVFRVVYIPYYAINDFYTSGSYNTTENVVATTIYDAPVLCFNYNGNKTVIYYSSTQNDVINAVTHMVRTKKSDGTVTRDTTTSYTHQCNSSYGR